MDLIQPGLSKFDHPDGRRSKKCDFCCYSKGINRFRFWYFQYSLVCQILFTGISLTTAWSVKYCLKVSLWDGRWSKKYDFRCYSKGINRFRFWYIQYSLVCQILFTGISLTTAWSVKYCLKVFLWPSRW